MADDITFIPQNQLCITKAGVYNMKRIPWSCWLLIGAMMILALCAVFFLPDQIVVQWNSNGVSGVADKWIVFVFPLLSLFIIAVTAVRKKAMQYTWPLLGALLLVFGCQCFIIINGLGWLNG